MVDFFDTNTGVTYASAVSGSVVKEIAGNATGPAITESGIADAVWNELLSGHTASGSAGEKLSNIPSSGSTDWTVNEKAEIKAILGVTNTGTPDNTPEAGAIYAMQGVTFDASTDSLEAVRNRGDAAWITATGFSTLTAEGVWSHATRALTDKSGFALSESGVDAIWDEMLSGHTISGSAGAHLSAAGVAGDPWTSDISTGYVGQAGEVLRQIKTYTNGQKDSGVYSGIEQMIRSHR